MARIAFLVGEQFEDSEFRVPYDRVREAGHEAVIIGVEAGRQLRGKKGRETITTEQGIGDVAPGDYDAVVIPGGFSPDHLRTDVQVVRFIRELFNTGQPVAAICHAGSLLIEADIADGCTLTSWPSIKTDLINAGARWVDQEVVEDGNLITSRKPDDLPAFCAALLRQIEQGVPARREPPLAPKAASERRPEVRH
jgi:protease I